MELIVLGAGPAYTDRPGATGAAYLVRHEATAILLDFGQGSFPALASRMRPEELDAVFISHLHPDHFVDLVPLRHYLRYQLDPPGRVRVLGPRGLGGRIDALHDEEGFTAAALDVEPLDGSEVHVGGLTVRAGRVTHTDESYGFRVSAGRGPGLVYSGDVGRADDLRPLIREGDTLLVEVSFGPGPAAPGAQHLDAPAVAELALATRPGRVLLTHIQMGFDRDETAQIVRARWGGPVELVDPGFVSTITADL